MVSPASFQAAGFPVGGEPLGVDLADTLVTVTHPVTDLLADPERCAAWWTLQSDRLPADAPAPTLETTRRLRAAARAALDAAQQGRNLPEPAVATLNQIAAAGSGRLWPCWAASSTARAAARSCLVASRVGAGAPGGRRSDCSDHQAAQRSGSASRSPAGWVTVTRVSARSTPSGSPPTGNPAAWNSACETMRLTVSQT